MILRRLTTALRKQDWFTVVIETLIVVFGVFIGLQVNKWNEARTAEQRRDQIVQALAADLADSIYVMEEKQVFEINRKLAAWEAAFESGEHPSPYYYRIEGADTAPDTWGVLQQMEIAGLFDPVTIFDLSYYYSKLECVGQKYVRYVNLVENEVLPFESIDPLHFYTEDGLRADSFGRHAWSNELIANDNHSYSRSIMKEIQFFFDSMSCDNVLGKYRRRFQQYCSVG